MSKRLEESRKLTSMPVKPFLYTLDQVAYILDMSESTLKASYMYFIGRTGGPAKKHFISARDISPPRSEHPDWRVAEEELIRWMRAKGFRFKDGIRLID